MRQCELVRLSFEVNDISFRYYVLQGHPQKDISKINLVYL